jgi:hypothetical protein
MNKTDLAIILIENRKVGGVFNFVGSPELMAKYMTSPIKNEQLYYNFITDYCDNKFTQFNLEFLRFFENTLKTNINRIDNYDFFIRCLYLTIKDIYLQNLNSIEKNLWKKNGKSLEKTLSRPTNNYDIDYVCYLNEKGYSQLSNLIFNIYLYYPIIGNPGEFNTWLSEYRTYLESEWRFVESPSMVQLPH